MEDSILKQVLIEELDRTIRMTAIYKEELEKLPKGSIVIKKIKGRPYNYLQFRDGDKVKSEYINESKVEKVKKYLERRKELKKSIKRADSNKKSLERALK